MGQRSGQERGLRKEGELGLPEGVGTGQTRCEFHRSDGNSLDMNFTKTTPGQLQQVASQRRIWSCLEKLTPSHTHPHPRTLLPRHLHTHTHTHSHTHTRTCTHVLIYPHTLTLVHITVFPLSSHSSHTRSYLPHTPIASHTYPHSPHSHTYTHEPTHIHTHTRVSAHALAHAPLLTHARSLAHRSHTHTHHSHTLSKKHHPVLCAVVFQHLDHHTVSVCHPRVL